MSYIIQSYYRRNEGFGSQMSDYASLYATCLMTGHTPAICSNINEEQAAVAAFNNNTHFPKTIEESFPNFNQVFHKINCKEHKFIDYIISIDGSSFLSEKYVTLGEMKHYLKPNINYNLCGRFVPKYWYSIYKKEIKKLYTFDQSIIDYAKNLLPKTDKNIIAISMRHEYNLYNRYSANYNRPVQCGLKFKYYYEAMSIFDRSNSLFLIFADHPEHNDLMLEGIKKYIPGYTEVVALPKLSSSVGMCLMSMCDHCIISNSTFSIWGALLNNNENAKIICPKYFINPKNCNGPINCNYFPDHWIAIYNT